MKLPKSKRMKNNASSALKEKQLINHIKNNFDDNKNLINKHKIIKNSYIKENAEIFSSTIENPQNPIFNHPSHFTTFSNGRQFTINSEIHKILLKSNFPPRFPSNIETETSFANVVIQETDNSKDFLPVSRSNGLKMTKNFPKFWNRVLSKQDFQTSSILDHHIIERESAYFPCKLKTLFDSPESYVKKPFCHKIRYGGDGFQFLPAGNHFSKVSLQSIAKKEFKMIFEHYFNNLNQFFIIPIEFSSKLSRFMRKSGEIADKTEGCNKIAFTCKIEQNFCEDKHPLLTIEYKSSVSLEVLPASSMSLVDNYHGNPLVTTFFSEEKLKKTLFNYPFLSHFLRRSDCWIDGFYARCWHYSRFFSDKLELGNRANKITTILVKDSFFKYLLACSARICVAIKYWVLNPEGATYFRCWCGEKLYDSKQESKMLKKMPIGSAELYNFQQNIRNKVINHNKHITRRSSHHICACNQHFSDHKQWSNHIFSTKLCDINKICPISMYMFAEHCTQDNRYVCQCNASFSDYDFWSFWLHVCGCQILKNSVKSLCRCSELNKCQKDASGVTPLREIRAIKRARTSSGARFVDKTKNKEISEEIGNEIIEDDSVSSLFKGGDKGSSSDNIVSLPKENNGSSDENWQSGDKIELPLKVSKQLNFNNNFKSENRRKRLGN